MVKTALITGGSHNIGQGIAIVLAEHGYDIAITYNRNPQGAEDTKAEIEKLGRRCFIYQASLGEADAPQRVVDQAHKDLGRLDVMVCNAANGGLRGSILTATPEKIDEGLFVNFRNYIMCAAAASRHMVTDKIAGNIIFITSSRAQRAYPDDFLYGGLKAGIERATESMALDLSEYNIRVNCVAPGATWPSDYNPGEIPFVKKSIPLHRVGTARENGEAVAYLVSDAASYITGITLRLDGGLILPGMMETYEPTVWVDESFRKNQLEKMQEIMKQNAEK